MLKEKKAGTRSRRAKSDPAVKVLVRRIEELAVKLHESEGSLDLSREWVLRLTDQCIALTKELDRLRKEASRQID